jgi:hypothetical protein
MMQPSQMSVFLMSQLSTFEAGRKRGVRVDGVVGVVEIKGRDVVAEGEVGLEVRLDRSDVLPVAAVDVGLDAHARDGVGDDVAAEVDELGVRQRLLEDAALEDVDAHRGEVAGLAAGEA